MSDIEKIQKNKDVTSDSADCIFSCEDLGHLVRLSLEGGPDEVRLFVARLVRKYRDSQPKLAEQLSGYLKSTPQGRSVMRRLAPQEGHPTSIPADADTRLSLLKAFEEAPGTLHPLFSPSLKGKLEQLIKERTSADKLAKEGLTPARSSIFTGPPGVGKTLAARWIAAQLEIPLYILDLTTVMSSLLGKTGANLRSVLDFARNTPCVLLLDEIDSIAKSRSDNADIGELKRLVTIMLQEIENWSGKSLLLAGTNFPELLDPAIWRRFDMIIEFPLPGAKEIEEAITLFSGKDKELSSKWGIVLGLVFKGTSFSYIEKNIYQMRRAKALGEHSFGELIKDLFEGIKTTLTKNELKEVIGQLAKDRGFSKRAIAELTGLSRDTVSKYAKMEKTL
jgi:hypothetical protein